VDCAAALFTEKGYDATTMEDIAECADVARGTVFNYFGRKEDLILAWFDRRRAELATALGEENGGEADTSGRLRRALRTIARLFTDDAATGRSMVRAWLQAGGPTLTPESETTHLFTRIIRSGQDAGDIAAHIDAVRAGQLLFDAYLGVLYRWAADDGDQYRLEESLLATLEILLDGLT
jgi:TetR/AcrR family transcriptional regulator, cholesterol catabolism regulator